MLAVAERETQNGQSVGSSAEILTLSVSSVIETVGGEVDMEPVPSLRVGRIAFRESAWTQGSVESLSGD